MAQDDAIVRLARQIDAARKAERFLVHADEVASLRRYGACELHRICAEFVSSVSRGLVEATLDFSPATYAPETFREPGVNLIQISSEGRQLLSQELHHYHRVIQRHSRATSTVA